MFSHTPKPLSLRLMHVCLLLVCCGASTFSHSQVTGRIAGTIKDERGALIVGAEITVASETTGQQRNVITGKDGSYSMVLLRPGPYRVRISASGFKSAVFDSVNVAITETTNVSVELPVANINVDEFVISFGPFVQSDGPQLGRVVNSRAVSE